MRHAKPVRLQTAPTRPKKRNAVRYSTNHAKPVRLKTAPTRCGSVYLFLEFIIKLRSVEFSIEFSIEISIGKNGIAGKA